MSISFSNMCRQSIGSSILLATFLLNISLPGTAGAETWGPWDAGKSQNRQPDFNDRIDPLDQAVWIFQKYISPVDGARCRMYPTCSSYARHALRKQGPVIGTFMAVDRLIHEIDPLEQREPIVKWGYHRYYDPVAYNDFWLTD